MSPWCDNSDDRIEFAFDRAAEDCVAGKGP